MPGKNYRNLRTDRAHARPIENKAAPEQPLKPGQVRCPTCGKPTKPRVDGSLRLHNDPQTGVECTAGLYWKDSRLVEHDHRNDKPNGKCHECGKPVTGERKLCGACMANRTKR